MKIRRNPKTNTFSITVDREGLRSLHGSIHQNLLAYLAYEPSSPHVAELRADMATLEKVLYPND